MSLTPKKHRANTQENGFILLYVVIAIVIFMALAISVVSTAVSQVEMSAQELSALRATVAADTAIECINYYMGKPSRPFDTMSGPATVNCGPGMVFTPYKNLSLSTCEPGSHTYNIGPLSGGSSYASITVQTIPRSLTFGNPNAGESKNFCAFRVAVSGCEGSCSSAQAVRTRWEDFGGVSENTSRTVPAGTDTIPGSITFSDPEPVGWGAYGVNIVASSSAVLQVAYKADPENDDRVRWDTQSNTVMLALLPPALGLLPVGPVINVQVTEPTDLENKLVIQLTDRFGNKIDGNRTYSGFQTGDVFYLAVGVLAGTDPGLYALRVTAHYINDADSVLIPLEIYSDTRGQI